MDPWLVTLFDQLIDGADFSAPEALLKVSRREAAKDLENVPYSLLTNLAHTVLWQSFWLRKMAGGRKRSTMTEWRQDFRVPEPEEWESLRIEFVEGLRAARAYAAGSPHKCDSDAEATDTLVRIALHAAYHCGQFALLKRMSKLVARSDRQTSK